MHFLLMHKRYLYDSNAINFYSVTNAKNITIFMM